MNLGMTWPRTVIWNATAVLRGSLESFIYSFIHDGGDDGDDGGGGGDEDDGLM